MTVNINVFRVDEKPQECLAYVEGHRKILETYGVTQVTSANLNWMNDPYTYVIMVKEETTGKVLAGARIQLASGNLPLPIETAIDNLDLSIYSLVKEKAAYRTGEFCGLWNSREIAGFGIGSIFLGRVGVSIISQLKLGSLFAFASQGTYRNCLKIGFRVMEEMGNKGTFYYPKEDLLATALLITDPVEILAASPEDRERILDLRENPLQTRIEKGPKGIIEIKYDLRINKESVIKLPIEAHTINI